MSVLQRSGMYSCLILRSRVQGSKTRYLDQLLLCGWLKTYCPRKFKSTATTSGFPSAPNLEQQQSHRRTSAESRFQYMMSTRQKQARHSVLIELSSKLDIPSILHLCKHYGEVENMVAFTSKKQKFQVITEFVHEESVQKLLSDSSLRYAAEVFPYYSRCLRFENCGKQGNPIIASDEVIDLSTGTSTFGCRGRPSSVSEMMIELYEREKMSELSTRLRFLSGVMLQDTLKGIFPYCTAFPFGSSVNGVGKDSSDLDVLLRLFPEQVDKNPELFLRTRYVRGTSHSLQRFAVHVIGDILMTFVPGVYNVQKVLNARVPIVKYENNYLNLECDVSVNNMSAVYMSEILFYCGELDPRVRPLIYTVKKWAREVGITTKEPGPSITNFSLTLLMLFFLQSRPIPVLPPLQKLIRLPSPDDYRISAVEYVNEENLNHLTPIVTGQNTETLDVLLLEFFRFVSIFPFKQERISVIAGVSNPRSKGFPICLDYPVDETKNVSKNVGMENLENICNAAFSAMKNLEKVLSTDIKTTDLMSTLGISDLDHDIPGRIDVRTFLDENSHPQEAVTGGR